MPAMMPDAGPPPGGNEHDSGAAQRQTGVTSSRGAGGGGWAILRLLRPHQWLKNSFVLAGLLFGHAWQDPQKLVPGLWAVAAFCLLRTNVRRSSKDHVDLRDRHGAPIGRFNGLGDAKINDLWRCDALIRAHQDITRLQVAMYNSLAVRVVDGIANFGEKLKPLMKREPFNCAKLRDRQPINLFHHEVGPMIVG